MNSCSDDEDRPRLSADTLAILQEFYQEQQQFASLQEDGAVAKKGQMPQEDWQLSQFWYDEDTAVKLAEEALAVAGENGKIACISCPTLYQKLRELKPTTCRAVILEYDNRFEAFGEDFIFYDYNSPLSLPKDLQRDFDIVVADPPFLSEECLLKTAQTIRYLSKGKILLCTGAIMEEHAAKFLKVHKCKFLPKHKNQLGNEFRCFTNYESCLLDKSTDF